MYSVSLFLYESLTKFLCVLYFSQHSSRHTLSSFLNSMAWVVSLTANIWLSSSYSFLTIRVIVDQLVDQLFSELQHASFSGITSFCQQLMISRFIDKNISIKYADVNKEPKQIHPPFSGLISSGVESLCFIALVDIVHMFLVKSNSQGDRYILLAAIFLLSLHCCH